MFYIYTWPRYLNYLLPRVTFCCITQPLKGYKSENTLMPKHVQRVRDNKAGFLRFVCIVLTRSFLQTGSEWQGGTELPQSTGSHGSKQTGMANTNTNTTASLHWNVATPALKLAGVREQWIHNEDTDDVNDTDKATLQMIYMSKTSKQRRILLICVTSQAAKWLKKQIKQNKTQQHYKTKQEFVFKLRKCLIFQ